MGASNSCAIHSLSDFPLRRMAVPAPDAVQLKKDLQPAVLDDQRCTMSWPGTVSLRLDTVDASMAAAAGQAVFDPQRTTLLVLSHLRWSFVYQRPQHLMTRFAREYNVLFLEEPVISQAAQPHLEARVEPDGVQVLVPHLPAGCEGAAAVQAQRTLLDHQLAALGVSDLMLWFYTPMALDIVEHLDACLVIYDCMDELSAFRGAPPALVERERTLLQKAQLVFTGGYSLWEAKRQWHCNVHAMPSSVDIAHFAQAREPQDEPEDMQRMPRPRLGFFGVIDERFDIDLVDRLARLRPDWQLVFIGPVVKIDPASLPQHPNVAYLGSRSYQQLPGYLASWDIAITPFALNESTRFISPTKTPEYLAGGCPVISTPVVDVVRSYGQSGVVHIASTAEEFIVEVEQALRSAADREGFLAAADRALQDMSWDNTWSKMMEEIRWLM